MHINTFLNQYQCAYFVNYFIILLKINTNYSVVNKWQGWHVCCSWNATTVAKIHNGKILEGFEPLPLHPVPQPVELSGQLYVYLIVHDE